MHSHLASPQSAAHGRARHTELACGAAASRRRCRCRAAGCRHICRQRCCCRAPRPARPARAAWTPRRLRRALRGSAVTSGGSEAELWATLVLRRSTATVALPEAFGRAIAPPLRAGRSTGAPPPATHRRACCTPSSGARPRRKAFVLHMHARPRAYARYHACACPRAASVASNGGARSRVASRSGNPYPAYRARLDE